MARSIYLIWGVFLPSVVMAQQNFGTLVGEVRVQDVAITRPWRVPYITWGGDVATFHANGGLKTAANSTYGQAGMNLQLVPGDDFVQQVKDYISGKSPFLRGTFHMLGQANEVIAKDPRTKPVVVLQLSWSAGDHIVSRESLKTLNDLRREGNKVRIACQQGGPHVGLLYDALSAAQIKKNEVEIVWVADLTGPKGPAQKFRDDSSVDACCVITPDMLGLTGGVDSQGSGAEGTVKGARVLVSTQQMSRSIADVYAVRSDWYAKHKSEITKFVAGYLKSTDAVVKMRKEFESTGKLSPEYRSLLQMAQNTFGKEVLPTLEVDAHGLLLDCTFVGLQGQESFFVDKGNLSGFDPTLKKALDMAQEWGYSSGRFGFDPPQLSYPQIAQLAGLKYEPLKARTGRIAETLDFSPEAELDDRTVVSFTINFEPNQSTFSADRYGAEFNRAIQAASTFGNAVVVVRGHSDPTKTLQELVRAGLENGLMKRTGQSGNYRYFIQGKPLDMNNTELLIELVQTGKFEGTNYKPRETMQAALNLSYSRASAVKDSLVQFAKQQRVNLDISQIQPVGAGILEPVIPRPTTMEEALENMRVEFRIVRVPAEAIHESDFDF
jgi:ABC-type nitrate/sulfonate/bicarbonate transport system substrate-binding protein